MHKILAFREFIGVSTRETDEGILHDGRRCIGTLGHTVGGGSTVVSVSQTDGG